MAAYISSLGVGVGFSVSSVDRGAAPKSPKLIRFLRSANRAWHRINRFRSLRIRSRLKRFGHSVLGLYAHPYVQRRSDPSFCGGQLLRPSTRCGGDFFPVARGTAAAPSPRCLGQVLDLIVISSGSSGCSVQISGFLCVFFVFLGPSCNLY